ncbi:hypothetical protein MVES_001210 [Malassezia vespertilionis]|uniref:Uncharacterized protein n=1 Tax=Malassezia vespertilionis TaxID=2020962 RepID=A0A2N1JEY0_9BASI|nr:hypothetical protein MVES_001210 [Malassezia vespertilionis]
MASVRGARKAPAAQNPATFDNDSDRNETEVVEDDIAHATADTEDESSGSEVEEVPIAATRQQAKQRSTAAQRRQQQDHATRRARQRNPTSSHTSRRARRAAQAATEVEEPLPTPAPVEQQQLDPALFAAAFAKSGDAAARAVVEQQRRAPPKKHALGVDGQPLVRINSGKTIVRALGIAAEHDVADAPLEHTALDPRRALPNAKQRSFKKRKLGLRASDIRPTALDVQPRVLQKRAARKRDHDDDPLGLHDPAFMPGGEYAHLTGRSKRGERPK